MADGTTLHYGRKKPENGASSDTWGIKWNENADDIDSDLKTVADAQLVKASNLSDLANAATARTNLGLGTAATQASTAFETAGAAAAVSAASCQRASNLSDLANASTARGDLGMGTGTIGVSLLGF